MKVGRKVASKVDLMVVDWVVSMVVSRVALMAVCWVALTVAY